MGFDFSGIFANGDAAVMEDFRREFCGVGRLITSPFVGFGVAFVEQAVPVPTPEDDPESIAAAERIVAFSARHAQFTFAYVYAECFGGVCEYAGFACRNGQRIQDEPFRDVVGDYEVLRRLLVPLGIDVGPSAIFEPLERDYFPSPFRRSPINTAAAVPRRDNQPMQRTGAAGMFSFVRKLLGRGSGR
ncbi:MAG: hypothetical protein WBD40_08300 [Tepidisphaeraceae bacterium]